ncbi:MAG: hypothetical protein JXX29_06000, partial [Deltaproteobacteria bacterium]|nr:hypothetical protein [Deltaproteobacteria bacterium]MBN2671202.1 hypothetical protein [Deltaproteobacteria bacterium]
MKLFFNTILFETAIKGAGVHNTTHGYHRLIVELQDAQWGQTLIIHHIFRSTFCGSIDSPLKRGQGG